MEDTFAGFVNTKVQYCSNNLLIRNTKQPPGCSSLLYPMATHFSHTNGTDGTERKDAHAQILVWILIMQFSL